MIDVQTRTVGEWTDFEIEAGERRGVLCVPNRHRGKLRGMREDEAVISVLGQFGANYRDLVARVLRSALRAWDRGA